jgi:hypothetical protein
MESCQATFCAHLKICQKWARFIRKVKLCKFIEKTTINKESRYPWVMVFQAASIGIGKLPYVVVLLTITMARKKN